MLKYSNFLSYSRFPSLSLILPHSFPSPCTLTLPPFLSYSHLIPPHSHIFSPYSPTGEIDLCTLPLQSDPIYGLFLNIQSDGAFIDLAVIPNLMQPVVDIAEGQPGQCTLSLLPSTFSHYHSLSIPLSQSLSLHVLHSFFASISHHSVLPTFYHSLSLSTTLTTTLHPLSLAHSTALIYPLHFFLLPVTPTTTP